MIVISVVLEFHSAVLVVLRVRKLADDTNRSILLALYLGVAFHVRLNSATIAASSLLNTCRCVRITAAFRRSHIIIINVLIRSHNLNAEIR